MRNTFSQNKITNLLIVVLDNYFVQVEDADDYNCVAENAGGVSEKNVTITFDQPVILGDSQVRTKVVFIRLYKVQGSTNMLKV